MKFGSIPTGQLPYTQCLLEIASNASSIQPGYAISLGSCVGLLGEDLSSPYRRRPDTLFCICRIHIQPRVGLVPPHIHALLEFGAFL